MPKECLEEESKKESKRIAAPWLRRLVAAAAVIALVVFIPITAKAFGIDNIWNVIARWAKETFSFVSGENADINEPNAERKEEFYSLQELLSYCEHESNMVPTWIPDGYSLEKIEQDISPIQEIYRAFYRNEDKALEIRVQVYIDSDPIKIEINEDLIEIIESNNIKYYIFSNYEQTRAIWVAGNYECYITGDVSYEIIKQMIDSTTKG